jgi:hypothetical protein
MKQMNTPGRQSPKRLLSTMMEPHRHALSFMTKNPQTTDGSFTLATAIAGQAEPPPKGTAPPSAPAEAQ